MATTITTLKLADGSIITTTETPKTYAAECEYTFKSTKQVCRIGGKNKFRKTEMSKYDFTDMVRTFINARNTRMVKMSRKIV